MLLSHRLGDETRHLCDADLTAEVGRRMLGFDHYAELGKLQSFGEAAAMARSIVIPAPHCSSYATVGLVSARDAPPVCWEYCKDGCAVVQAGGLRVGGHSSSVYNGTYAAVDERGGWPVLQNEHGVWLFRCGLQEQDNCDTWRLWHEHTWNVDRSLSPFPSSPSALCLSLCSLARSSLPTCLSPSHPHARTRGTAATGATHTSTPTVPFRWALLAGKCMMTR